MPHFSASYGHVGPLIEIHIGLSGPRVEYLTKNNLPLIAPILAKGLVDTGASNTMVDPSIITGLGLKPRRKAFVTTPSTGPTPSQFFTYDVATYIAVNGPIPWFRVAMEVTGSNLKHQGFEVLIGRDILSEALLVYDGKSNRITLAF